MEVEDYYKRSERRLAFEKIFHLPWCRDGLSLRNVFAMSLGISVVLAAYEGTRTLQTRSNHRPAAVDDICECATFTASLLSLIFLPKLIIRKYGYQTTIIVSILAYCPFVLSTYYARTWLSITSSVLLGIASSNLFTAISTYLSDTRFLPCCNRNQRRILTFNFGCFLAMIQHRYIWSCAISLCLRQCLELNASGYFTKLVLKDKVENHVANSSIPCEKNCSVGIQQELPADIDANNMLVGIYFTLCVMAAVFLRFFLEPFYPEVKTEGDYRSVCRNFMASVKHPQKKDLSLLIIFTVFVGLQEGFMFEHYFKHSPFVYAMGPEKFHFQFSMLSLVCCLGSTMFILIVFPRGVGMTAAALLYVYVCVSTSEPYTSDSAFFWISTMWTITNSIFQVELSALYGSMFDADHEAAFANYFFWITMGYHASTPRLSPYARMAMLLVFMVFGMIGYGIVEFRYWKQEVLHLKFHANKENLLKEKSEQGSLILDFKMASHKDYSLVDA